MADRPVAMPSLTATQPSSAAGLGDALAGSDPEPALEQAFARLGGGCDWPFLVAMVKALVRSNLAGIAIRLLRTAGRNHALSPQIDLLVEELGRLPSGETPGDVLQRRYQANRLALLRRYPNLANLLSGEAAPRGVRVFASAKGSFHAVRDIEPGGGLNLILPFTDQIARSVELKLLPLNRNSGAFLLNGVPSAPLWQRLLSLKSESGYTPPIDLLEPDAEILRIWLMIVELGSVLDDERVTIIAGPDALDQYREHLAQHDWRLSNLLCLTSARAGSKPPIIDQQFHESVASAVKARRARIAAGLAQRYGDRSAAHWRDRFHAASHGGAPLQIVGFTSRYSTVMQHAMRDLAGAFTRKGCRFETIMQANPHHPTVDVGAALEARDADLIVVINHLRAEFAEIIPGNIPYVCWIQDHMDQLCTTAAGRSVGAFDLVLGHSVGLLSALYEYPRDRFLATSNLTDASTYSADPLPPHELDPHRCALSYIGHGSTSAEALAVEMAGEARHVRELLLDFVANVRCVLGERGWVSHAERLALALQAERRAGLAGLTASQRRAAIVPALERLFDRVLRHQALQWAADWAIQRGRTFRIYGRGWNAHPTLARFACGEVANGRALRAVYQASAVSLHVTAFAGLHQRLLDGLASGAFLLVRFNPFDFLVRPLRVLQRCIRGASLGSLTSLLELAKRDELVSAAIAECHALGHGRIAAASDDQRRQEADLLRTFYGPHNLADDRSLFDSLATMQHLPQRATCDLPEFDAITFDSAAKLHALLDDHVDNADVRRSITQPMRANVLANDTFDVLADRVLEHFRKRFASPAAASSA